MSIVHRDPQDRVQVLDKNGDVVEGADVPDVSDDKMVEMYAHMRLARRFDERAVSLQRQGRMGTYPPLSGQEAAQVGSAHALDDDDWIIPSYREHAAVRVHGLSLEDSLLYWMGHEKGNQIAEDINVFTVAVPIATHIPHATGMSWASKLKGEQKAFICYFGDGATSEGDFHEGLNFAGVFNTPTIFFCNNNQWAISVPRERQTASETLAQKATAYGFEGVQVDGMDPLAVYKVTKQAVDKAKNPGDKQLRPTLIEAVQYRYGAHTTADDPSKYRDEEEVEKWKERDPIKRLENFLVNRGVLDDEKIDTIEDRVEEELTEAIDTAEAYESEPDEFFEYVYSEMPEHLEEQRDYFNRMVEKYGREAFKSE